MYLNRRLLWSALRIAIWEQPFSLRRWGWIALFAALYAPTWLLVSLARGLDRLFLPAVRRQPLRAPLFIVGAPRSGTSFLQYLLALDEEHFTHVKLYHTILPSALLVRGIQSAISLDRRWGRPFERAVSWLE